MPLTNLEAFKYNLYDICRPNRFKVSFTGKNTFGLNEADYYMVKGASLPGKTLGEIDLNWMGMKYKIAGDATFEDITITFWNDIPVPGGTPVRTKFINWMNTISNDAANTKGNHLLYKCTVVIEQLDGMGLTTQKYSLINAHPKELSSIELSMDNPDTMEEFTVSFSYSYVETGSSLLRSVLSGATQIAGRFL